MIGGSCSRASEPWWDREPLDSPSGSLTTRGKLEFLPEKGTQLILSADTTDAESGLLPEFGIDCFGSLCSGTTYCLPGPGDGGSRLL